MSRSIDTTQALRQALASFGYTDYVRHLPAAERCTEGARQLRIAILRSYTAEPIEPVLRVQLAAEGYRATCWFGRFDQYSQDVLDPASELWTFNPDVVLLLVRIDDLLPPFVNRFANRSSSEWREELASRAGLMGSLARQVTRIGRAQLIVQNASLSSRCLGVFDSQSPDGQHELVRQFNELLTGEIGDVPGAFIWDFDHFVRRYGYDHLYDPKSWYVSRNPFKQSAYPALTTDLLRYLRSALGHVRKCVVVDLDNTLWGGIAAEDGIAGVRLGATYPGNCFRDLQRELLRLYDRGILLAVNSKNNEADALRIIEQHPAMVLRREHFAAMRINWQDKAANLREIAAELNIGLDSLIFIDDNPAECALVSRECPDCDVVLLPEKPYLLPTAVASLPGIDNLVLTHEDRQKGRIYAAQAERRRQERQHTDVEGFLRSLDIEVGVEAANTFSIPRIAQLTQKTNQWNMTTRRYTESDIRRLAEDPACAVLSVASRDRFGDDGIIGVCILAFDAGECVIDNFLLSCRVIGRGIEQLMMARIVELARDRGSRVVAGEFIPTSRNTPASGFYERAGLKASGGTWYRARLDELSCPPPPHIRVATGSLVSSVAPAVPHP